MRKMKGLIFLAAALPVILCSCTVEASISSVNKESKPVSYDGDASASEAAAASEAEWKKVYQDFIDEGKFGFENDNYDSYRSDCYARFILMNNDSIPELAVITGSYCHIYTIAKSGDHVRYVASLKVEHGSPAYYPRKSCLSKEFYTDETVENGDTGVYIYQFDETLKNELGSVSETIFFSRGKDSTGWPWSHADDYNIVCTGFRNIRVGSSWIVLSLDGKDAYNLTELGTQNAANVMYSMMRQQVD